MLYGFEINTNKSQWTEAAQESKVAQTLAWKKLVKWTKKYPLK